MTKHPPIDTFIQAQLPIINTAIQNALDIHTQDQRQILIDAMQYSTLGGGKRIRALLAILTYQLFSSQSAAILPFAVACEMIHTYSLIHDDLPAMDNDDFRRGQPTCHKKFDENIAILAGDQLNTYTFEYLSATLPEHFSANAILKAIHYFAQSLGVNGMVGGQVLDLQSHHHNDLDYLQKTHRYKTGALLEACITVPGILAEADASTKDTLQTLGQHIGLLFQITDDILDHTGQKETLGKSIGKDAAQNKLTYVSLMGIDGAERAAQDEANAAIACCETLENETQLIEALIEKIRKRTS